MLVFPNCKINLGLLVNGKREDGYHNIETVFYPIPLKDALEIIDFTNPGQSPATVFTQSGNPIESVENDNLCLKAYELLKKDFPQLPPVKIHLHKKIPIGAGLGGGSADASFTLMALNGKYVLNLSNDQLLSYALQLGSDCSFFIINKPCIASGRGENMEPIDLALTGYQLVLVNPGIHVNTRWAFSQLSQPAEPATKATHSLRTTVLQPVSNWKDSLINDFEKFVFVKYPEIMDIKRALYEKGALYSAMSGSGSTVFGIFNDGPDHFFNFPQHYFVHRLIL